MRHDDAPHRSLPWVRVRERLGWPDYDALAAADSPPLPPSARDPAASGADSVAVCLSGQARTLVQPTVWRAVAATLLDDAATGRRRRPLYMVLTTRGEVSDLHHSDLGAAEACGLQDALDGLRPRRLRLVFHRPDIPCGNSEAAQFSKWSDCVDLVRADERASGGTLRYAHILRARPDLLWTTPATAVDALIARVDRLPGTPIVTSNDWAMLAPRRWWNAVAAFRQMECAARCGPEGPAVLRDPFGTRNNSYCLMISHLAAHGAPHVEASHPDGALARHYRSTAPWSAALRAPALRIHRAALPASAARAGWATLCRPHADAWHCTYCRAAAPARRAVTPSACPADTWDAVPSPTDDATAPPRDCATAPTPLPWAENATRAGHCGGTAGNTPCGAMSHRMPRGSWDADKSGIRSLAECVQVCRTCDACVFVSFHLGHNDCSWYTRCAMRRLIPADGYRSVRVRADPGPPPAP